MTSKTKLEIDELHQKEKLLIQLASKFKLDEKLEERMLDLIKIYPQLDCKVEMGGISYRMDCALEQKQRDLNLLAMQQLLKLLS